MKKILITVLTFGLTLNYCFSQDTISFNSGESVLAKVVDTTSNFVSYKDFTFLTGPTIQALKTKILMIRYENGTFIVYSDIPLIYKDGKNILDTNITSKLSDEQFFILGKSDASKYYKGAKKANIATAVLTIVSVPVPIIGGLITATACSSSPPKPKNLNFPYEELSENSAYYNGYTARAKKIKQNKVWRAFGLATVPIIAVGVAILVAWSIEGANN